MMAAESLRSGWSEIASHKMRSFLSFSAVAFGVAAILYTFAKVHWVRIRVRQAMDLAGHGRLDVHEKREYVSRGLSKGLSWADARAIREALPRARAVSAEVQSRWVEFRDGKFNLSVVGFGITPDWARNNWVYALRGRFLDWDDVARASRVCIVIEPGRWKKKPFWASLRKPDEFERHVSHNDMLGRRVLIGGHSFLVVGVLAPPLKDKDLRWFGRGREEKIVYLPITTCQRVLGFGAGPPPDRVDSIFVDAGSEAAVPSAKRTVESLLRARHGGEEDFDVRDWRETMQGAVSSVRKGCIAVLSVGVIAILAGGIGIMNVTLAVIFSRIREIGIRRAVGARRRDIMAQFVLEAMLLGLLGGIAGCALGLAGIAGLSPDGAEQMLSLRPWHLLGAVGIAVAAGLLFSLYPARQASRLEPVEALRFE